MSCGRLDDRYVRYLKSDFARLALDIRLIAMPVFLVYFNRNRTEKKKGLCNATVKYVMALEQSANLVTNKCMHNCCGTFSKRT